MKTNLTKLTLITLLLLTCTSALANTPQWSNWSKPYWFKSVMGEVYGVMLCTSNTNHLDCYYRFKKKGFIHGCKNDATIKRFNVSPAKKNYRRPVISNVRCE